jgi:4,5-dihydroxyphthalate decarboxylase
MKPLPLLSVTRTQGNNESIKDGRIAPAGFALEFVEVPVLVHAFRRMVRERAFDVCEMALTTYLCAKEHGKRITALPIFLVRGFHHGAIVHASGAASVNPAELEGQRVGVNRGYTVTTGVWARAILADEHGVDLDRTTWVLSGDEHVAEYRPPANVIGMPAGANLYEMLAAGDIAAAIGIDGPSVRPVLADPDAAALAALCTRGFYPINHLIVVRDELLDEHPRLAGALFEAFAAAKANYVRRLRSDAIEDPTPTDRMYRLVLDATGEDPLPYGVEPNRAILEKLVGHAVRQRILARRPAMQELFAAGTLDLIG